MCNRQVRRVFERFVDAGYLQQEEGDSDVAHEPESRGARRFISRILFLSMNGGVYNTDLSSRGCSMSIATSSPSWLDLSHTLGLILKFTLLLINTVFV